MEIKVVSQLQKIVINAATNAVSVINTGPQGPPGLGVAPNIDGGSASEIYILELDIDGGGASGT